MNDAKKLNAVGYTRHRSEDFLHNQQEVINNYCSLNNLNLVGTYTDHCVLEKNFGKADYAGLQSFLQKFGGRIEFVIVENYDRLSRNMSECIQRIDELESVFNVKVLSCNKGEPDSLGNFKSSFLKLMSQLTAEDNVK